MKISLQKKILFLGLPTLVVLLALFLLQGPIFRVSAQIVPVTVGMDNLSFGTVFPGEELEGDFIVTYADGGEGIGYRIIQKRKPLPPEHPEYPNGGDPEMPGYYRNLCPRLTKINTEGEGDIEDNAFVGGPNDPSDTWVIYFKVPAIFGHVAQDHTGGVVNDSGEYGCDISIDITEAFVIDTIIVPSDGNTVSSNIALVNGREYMLKASGTYRFANWGDYGIADAEWAYRNDGFKDNPLPVHGWTLGENTYPFVVGLDVQVDGNNVYWGDFNSEHIYTVGYTGMDSTVSFFIYDSNYGDNSGSITVEIYELP